MKDLCALVLGSDPQGCAPLLLLICWMLQQTSKNITHMTGKDSSYPVNLSSLQPTVLHEPQSEARSRSGRRGVCVCLGQERATVQYGQILFNIVSYSSLKIQSFLR